MTRKRKKAKSAAPVPNVFGVPELGPRQETRFTWNELARLEQLVRYDLYELQRINDLKGSLSDLIKDREELLAKVELMRVEAYRRETTPEPVKVEPAPKPKPIYDYREWGVIVEPKFGENGSEQSIKKPGSCETKPGLTGTLS